jgi:hypothetical protein
VIRGISTPHASRAEKQINPTGVFHQLSPR